MLAVSPEIAAKIAVVVEPLTEVGVAAMVVGDSSTTLLFPASAMKTSPIPSTAMPLGFLKPEPRVTAVVVPARTSLTVLLPVSAKKTSPALSIATPCGLLSHEPIVTTVLVPAKISLTAP